MCYIYFVRCLTIFGKWVTGVMNCFGVCRCVLLICAFFFAAYDEPYLLALLTYGVEMWRVEPRLLIQSVTVPKPSLVVCCHQLHQLVMCGVRFVFFWKTSSFSLHSNSLCIIIMIRLFLRCQIHYGSWGLYIYIYIWHWLTGQCWCEIYHWKESNWFWWILSIIMGIFSLDIFSHLIKKNIYLMFEGWPCLPAGTVEPWYNTYNEGGL
jgi:hypothetical protein